MFKAVTRLLRGEYNVNYLSERMEYLITFVFYFFKIVLGNAPTKSNPQNTSFRKCAINLNFLFFSLLFTSHATIESEIISFRN